GGGPVVGEEDGDGDAVAAHDGGGVQVGGRGRAGGGEQGGDGEEARHGGCRTWVPIDSPGSDYLVKPRVESSEPGVLEASEPGVLEASEPGVRGPQTRGSLAPI